jgi:hypothetical protein
MWIPKMSVTGRFCSRTAVLALVGALFVVGGLSGCDNNTGSGGDGATDQDVLSGSDIDLDGLDVDQDVLSQLDIKNSDTIGGDASDAQDSGTDAIEGPDAITSTDTTDTADSGSSDVASGCSGDGACDDQNICTDDKCGTDGVCTHSFNAVPCADGVTCTTDTCAEGKCVSIANDASCTDGDGCTTDVCDLALGCTHTAIADDTACDDGNACTLGEVCSNGFCVGGGLNTCDDSNPCTIDACDAASGCSHVAVDAGADGTPTCSDGNSCTTGDTCAAGLCVGVTVACADDNFCTDDTCNPDSGLCVYVPNTASCDDGVACSTGDVCNGGSCMGTLTDSLCDDSNPCTSDWCSTDGGCNHAAAEASCSDGDPCTIDTCVGMACKSAAKICNDGNDCTGDNCDPSSGECVTSAIIGGACVLSDACVVGAGCVEGKCVVTEALVCKDDNLCTDDSCDASLGCVFLANAATCDDGDLCTDADTCANKKCGGAEKVCPGNPQDPQCSIGFCDGLTGQCGLKSAAWFEDFSRKGKGWQVSGEWQIGLAMASTPVGDVNADPGSDADGNSSGYLAGMVIGGNIDNGLHDWYYLTSPVIDLSAQATATAILDIQAAGEIIGTKSQETKVEFTADGQTWVDVATIGDINKGWGLLSQYVNITSEFCTAKFQFRIGYRVVVVIDYILPIVAGLSVDNIAIYSGNCW